MEGVTPFIGCEFHDGVHLWAAMMLHPTADAAGRAEDPHSTTSCIFQRLEQGVWWVSTHLETDAGTLKRAIRGGTLYFDTFISSKEVLKKGDVDPLKDYSRLVIRSSRSTINSVPSEDMEETRRRRRFPLRRKRSCLNRQCQGKGSYPEWIVLLNFYAEDAQAEETVCNRGHTFVERRTCLLRKRRSEPWQIYDKIVELSRVAGVEAIWRGCTLIDAKLGNNQRCGQLNNGTITDEMLSSRLCLNNSLSVIRTSDIADVCEQGTLVECSVIILYSTQACNSEPPSKRTTGFEAALVEVVVSNPAVVQLLLCLALLLCHFCWCGVFVIPASPVPLLQSAMDSAGSHHGEWSVSPLQFY
ncbi:hypothetical protein Tco_0951825 [Tanacetum coccineum]|uniref:Uncharacterized protein n=1 Tax=Tanacetum coccineum TaxID=301880 RepID=A0ABQ5DVA8_9ASTR